MLSIPKLSETFTFGDIISIIALLGSLGSAIVSWIKSREAKDSEIKAGKYAKDANDHDLSAKKYYDEMLLQLKNKNEKEQREDYKREVLMLIVKNNMATTIQVAEHLKITVEDANTLLKEMERIDKLIDGFGDVRFADKAIWKKR